MRMVDFLGVGQLTLKKTPELLCVFVLCVCVDVRGE